MENGANGVPMVLVPFHAEEEPKQEHELALTLNHSEVEIHVLAVLHHQLHVTTGIVQASYLIMESFYVTN